MKESFTCSSKGHRISELGRDFRDYLNLISTQIGILYTLQKLLLTKSVSLQITEEVLCYLCGKPKNIFWGTGNITPNICNDNTVATTVHEILPGQVDMLSEAGFLGPSVREFHSCRITVPNESAASIRQ